MNIRQLPFLVHGNALYNRGIVLGNLGRHDEALTSFARALALNPKDADIWHNCGVALGNLEQHDEALASFDRAIALNPEYADAWYVRGLVYLRKFFEFVEQHDIAAARRAWAEGLSSGQQSGNARWPDVVAKTLFSIAQMGQLELARQLISESAMEEQLFPLARALDYLQSGDEALIEKLSPEVKGIVEEVAAKLQPGAKEKKERKEKKGKRRRAAL